MSNTSFLSYKVFTQSQVKKKYFFLKNVLYVHLKLVNKNMKINLHNKKEKNLKIKESLMKTKNKRLSQRCVVYKIKVNENALTKI